MLLRSSLRLCLRNSLNPHNTTTILKQRLSHTCLSEFSPHLIQHHDLSMDISHRGQARPEPVKLSYFLHGTRRILGAMTRAFIVPSDIMDSFQLQNPAFGKCRTDFMSNPFFSKRANILLRQWEGVSDKESRKLTQNWSESSGMELSFVLDVFLWNRNPQDSYGDNLIIFIILFILLIFLKLCWGFTCRDTYSIREDGFSHSTRFVKYTMSHLCSQQFIHAPDLTNILYMLKGCSRFSSVPTHSAGLWVPFSLSFWVAWAW